MKELANIGIGTNINRADPAIIQDDEQPWKSEVKNMNTAQEFPTVYILFYNGKLFALRAKGEHRNMDSSQFSINHDHGTKILFLEIHGKSCNNVQRTLKLTTACK